MMEVYILDMQICFRNMMTYVYPGGRQTVTDRQFYDLVCTFVGGWLECLEHSGNMKVYDLLRPMMVQMSSDTWKPDSSWEW